MLSFLRIRTSGFENFPELLAKFWISFKSHLIDPKFHGDHEYVVKFDDSSMVEELWLLPVYFRKIFKKLASELCSVYSSQYC
jgi:hypothetical protein